MNSKIPNSSFLHNNNESDEQISAKLRKNGNNNHNAPKIDHTIDCNISLSKDKPSSYFSPWGIFFILLIFGPLILIMESTIYIKLLVIMAIWWSYLFAFWVLPAFSHFDAEKKWISNHRKTNTPTLKNIIISTVYYFLYWPIFIQKWITFWLLAATVMVYNFIKIFGE